MNKSQRVTPFWHNDTRSRVTVTFGARRAKKAAPLWCALSWAEIVAAEKEQKAP
jgi:hypothetical protein